MEETGNLAFVAQSFLNSAREYRDPPHSVEVEVVKLFHVVCHDKPYTHHVEMSMLQKCEEMNSFEDQADTELQNVVQLAFFLLEGKSGQAIRKLFGVYPKKLYCTEYDLLMYTTLPASPIM